MVECLLFQIGDSQNPHNTVTTSASDDSPLGDPFESNDDVDLVKIAFPNKAIADRVSTAFAHAILLSGGKVSKEVF
jgi:hypothetical protein